jgi:2-polyprenyl-3-methyl-5-hydroxy-6-metoxy-1,4-benzoquinol methylase
MTRSQKDLYDARWRDQPAELGRETRLWLHRFAEHQELVAGLLKQLDVECPEVLELGCGVGGIANWLASQGVHVTAIDVSPEAIQAARRRAASLDRPPVFHCAELRRTADWVGPFHVVLAFDLIEHLPPDDLLETLTNVGRMLSPGGLFLCTTPNRTRLVNRLRALLGRPLSMYEAHEHEYAVDELLALLARAGLKPTSIAGCHLVAPGWTFGVPLVHPLSRWLGRAFPRLAAGLVVVATKAEEPGKRS